MDDLLSEEEQIDQLRAWWADNGSYVIGGIVLGAAILFGFNYYQGSQLDSQMAASALYDTLAEHIDEGDLEAAEAVASSLADEYAGTSYYPQSKLALARLYADKNRDEDAAAALRDLLSSSSQEALKAVARVRLAKILLYQNKPDEVLTLLEGQETEAFAARYAEARGDALTMLGRYDEARAAFEIAAGEVTAQPTVDQTFVQLKLLDLPTEGELAAAQTEGAGASGAVDDVVDGGADAEPIADSEPVQSEDAAGDTAQSDEEQLAGDEESE